MSAGRGYFFLLSTPLIPVIGTIKMLASQNSLSVKYLWADEANPKPIDVSAQQYIQLLMVWIDSKFADETLFPMEGPYRLPYFLDDNGPRM
jgi:hypothetical protein